MCCLYGILNYGNNLKDTDIKSLLHSLGIAAMERGTHATGIAYVNNGNIEVQKTAKPACDFTYRLPKGTKVVMGHTRLATQGRAEDNYNNHPFYGAFKKNERAVKTDFALAHNGVLHNDMELRKKYKLPDTKIKTDSYVAIQLLEQQKLLNMDSVKLMAESVEGSFCFSILDSVNNLYLVKGNNPLSVVHHKKLGIYVYASTEQILWAGIVSSNLFPYFKSRFTNTCSEDVEEIPLNQGEILKITATGSLERKSFSIKKKIYSYQNMKRSSNYSTCGHFGYLDYFDYTIAQSFTPEDLGYISQLKTFAKLQGEDEEIVDALLDEGFGIYEVEEFLLDTYNKSRTNFDF